MTQAMNWLLCENEVAKWE